jgi:transaldolase
MKESNLNKLKKLSNVVVDTGDFELIKQFNPSDATTNPSLILKSVKDDKYKSILKDSVSNIKSSNKYSNEDELVKHITIDILARFGTKILEIIDGKVSSEVDARLSFDIEKTVEYAKDIICQYSQYKVSKENILIKIAATWEGIKAAEILQNEGINCNLTLIFDKGQAQACADANVYLISPFVGRITDWQIAEYSLKNFPSSNEDLGVLSVKEIYNIYKKQGSNTIVMGASFRNTGQILALAGCDALTIAPPLLTELDNMTGNIDSHLKYLGKITSPSHKLSQEAFRWSMNENKMATLKLSDGIRAFANDTVELEKIIKQNI